METVKKVVKIKIWILVVMFSFLLLSIAIGTIGGYNYHKTVIDKVTAKYMEIINEKEKMIEVREQELKESENAYRNLKSQINKKIKEMEQIKEPLDLNEIKKRFKEVGYETIR